MKDLFGAEIPDPPPMNAPLPWLVFRMDDYEWWVARSLDEARTAYEAGRISHAEAMEATEDARELSAAELESMKFTEDGKPVSTFADELARRVAAGLSAPEFFAGTEW
jgi:hypothetical protein